jgi:predicted DNA-binding protein (MmcQ/YjbR family)
MSEPRPARAALRAHCAAKPDAVEAHMLHERFFRVRGRAFVFLNSPHDPEVTVRVPRAARRALLAHPAVRRARWISAFGWVTIRVTDDAALALAFELIDRSYDAIAGPRV